MDQRMRVADIAAAERAHDHAHAHAGGCTPDHKFLFCS